MGNISTLAELLEKYDSIEIPKIQRDYAQGRSDARAKEIREKLLSDIKGALKNNQPLDINFIYGKEEDGKFIPLDGQQRLTTLFLLHLYAYADDAGKTDKLKKFTYETRPTSREFLKLLTEKRADVFKGVPSKKIEDALWYRAAWDNDPTVKSAKVVLDEIANAFTNEERSALAEKLWDPGNAPAKFSHMDMEELSLTDSLYIKLNARGRMLTPFENYKAELIRRVRGRDFKGSVNADDFSDKLDGEWTDMFWNAAKPAMQNPDANAAPDPLKDKFDAPFKAFFDTLFMAYDNFKRRNIKNTKDKEFKKFKEYAPVSAITPYMAAAAYSTLDFTHKNSAARERLFSELNEINKGDGQHLTERLFVFALGALCARMGSKLTDGIYEGFMRVIDNLLLNTDITARARAENFANLLFTIDVLAQNADNLLNYIENNDITKLPVISEAQAEEERVKAALINRGYGDIIRQAEAHKYFGGQLRGALEPAGISIDTVQNASDDELKALMAEFEKYWKALSGLFDDKKPKDGVDLRRALLSIGDFTSNLRNDVKTLYGDSPEAPQSIKGLFADQNKNNITKQLLDEIAAGSTLSDIIGKSAVEEDDWRYCLINYPPLFNVMNPRYYRIWLSSKNYLLAKNEQFNCSKIEMFSYALAVELSNGAAPENKPDAYHVKLSSWEEPVFFNYKGYKVRYDQSDKAFKLSPKSGGAETAIGSGGTAITDAANAMRNLP